MQNKGFTLIEILIVVAILGVLAVISLMVINPREQLTKTRDTGRIAAINQLGRFMQSFYSSSSGAYPNPLTWDQELINSGQVSTFPQGIRYSEDSGVIPCTTNAKPAAVPTFCFDSDISGNNWGVIVFAKLESQIQRGYCIGNGDTYFVYSTADSRAGAICSSSDPITWEPGTQIYVY